MQLDNILILGDSFCRDKEGWPRVLINRLIHPKSNSYVCGISGAGWWLTRKNLLSLTGENSKFITGKSLLIYIHTHRSRLFNLDQSICQALPKNIDPSDDEITLAVSLYRKYIADNDFELWAQDQWFKEYNEIANKFTNVINLLFDQEQHSAHPLAGITVPTALLDMVRHERDNRVETLANDGVHGFINHFSPENNIVFAEQLFDILAGRAKDFDLSQFSKTTLDLVK